MRSTCLKTKHRYYYQSYYLQMELFTFNNLLKFEIDTSLLLVSAPQTKKDWESLS